MGHSREGTGRKHSVGNPPRDGASGAKGAGQGGCWSFQRDLLAALRDDLDLPVPC